MCNSSGGANALRGFIYQFLYTLQRLMGEVGSLRASVSDSVPASDGLSETLFRVEAREDLEAARPGECWLFQLKDRATFGPAEFGEVLSRFAQEYTLLRGCNPHFVLYTSADLSGTFYGPFMVLCERLRRTTDPSEVENWQFTRDLGTSPIVIPAAAVWQGDSASEPASQRILGGYRTDSVQDFLVWMTERQFIQNAGVDDISELIDLLSRVQIDGGNTWDDVRRGVLTNLEGRLPTNLASERLQSAIGYLCDWAARSPGLWTPAATLLRELGIPPREISWESVREGCRARLTTETMCPDDGAFRVDSDALAYLRLWTRQLDRKLFVLVSRGYEDESQVMGQLGGWCSEHAPTLIVAASTPDGDIVSQLLESAGWRDFSPTPWTLPSLLIRLRDSIDRSRDRPSVVILVDRFAGSEIHVDWFDRHLTLARETAGLALVLTQEYRVRTASENSRVSRWASDVWQAPSSSPRWRSDELLPVSCRLLPAASGSNLGVAIGAIARRCRRRRETVTAELLALASVACSPEHPTGQITPGEFPAPAGWDWGSTRYDQLPQAAVDEELLRWSAAGVSFTTMPAAIELISRGIDRLSPEEQVELARVLARFALPHPVILEGFAQWLHEFSQRPEVESRLGELLRPWVEYPSWPWRLWLFGMAGAPALVPLAQMAEEAAREIPEDPNERARLTNRLIGIFDLMKATEASHLTEWVREWSRRNSGWLRQQVLVNFPDSRDQESLEMLLTELRSISTGSEE
jgi:hypothetical protein